MWLTTYNLYFSFYIWQDNPYFTFYSCNLNLLQCSLRSIRSMTKAVARRSSVKMVFLEISQNSQEITCARSPGANPAFVIRGGPNPEHFLSNLRKLLKKGKFFLTTKSLIAKRNWVYINQFIKPCFSQKKRLLTWYFFGWFLFCF